MNKLDNLITDILSKTKIKVIYGVVFGIVFLIFCFNIFIISTNAQGVQTGIVNIDVTLESIENKRIQVAELRQKQTELERENLALNIEIQDLKLQIAKTNPQNVETIAQLQSELENKTKLYEENQALIESNDTQINATQIELQNEIDRFRREVVTGGRVTATYLSVLIVIWVLYEVIIWVSKKFLPERIHSVIRIVALVLAFISSIIIVFIAFADKLEFLFASIGVISAALVVALQDLVSSFFAWLLITSQKQYNIKDIIKVGKDQNSITGYVSRIGILRTYLDQRIGDLSTLDFEQKTGKVISFPNNFIFSEPLINFTKNDPYLWYNYKLTITFESDADLANEIITDYMNKWYLDHTEIKGKKQREEYYPIVYTHIADDGPCFTIWFASRTGLYRSELKQISLDLLKVLKQNKIDLAYKTFRALTENPKVNSK
jgi:small-conductance mechanosensitive channel